MNEHLIAELVAELRLIREVLERIEQELEYKNHGEHNYHGFF